MLKSLKIVYRLFRGSFLLTGILYLIALLLFISVVGLKDAYKASLQNEFATKQPHIKVTYINNNLEPTKEKISKSKQAIKDITPKIDEVSEYVSGNRFFTSIGFKDGGNAQYSGDIKIIGVGKESFVYDFFDSNFVSRKPFEIRYTPLEFIYAFKSNDNIMVFNKALFNSYFPVVESSEDFIYEHDKERYKAKLASVFNDYDKQPIIYTTLSFANKLMNQSVNKIDGYFVNTKSLNEIDAVTQILKNSLSKDEFIVSSWLEQREKQFMMFFLFESLSLLVVSVILFLSILFILLLLYNSIVQKSYQLSVLFTMGFSLKKEIFIAIVLVMSVVSFIASVFLYSLLPQLIASLSLVYSRDMFFSHFIYICVLNILFMLISFILINSSYKIKAKSVF